MNAFDRRDSASFNFTAQDSVATVPVDIQFRHMRESRRVIEQVEQLMDRFDKYSLQGARVDVVVDKTHHRLGKSVFQVKVKLKVPGERLYVAQSAEKPGRTDGIYVALATAFDHVERQLVKRHDRRSKRRTLHLYDEVA